MQAGKQGSLVKDSEGAAGNAALLRAAALGAAACGIITIALAGPRLMAALVSLQADPVLARVERGEAPPVKALERLVDSRSSAMRWHVDGRAWLAIGLARLDVARREEDDSARRRRQLDRAIFALEHGLAMAPDNAAAWMRLGEALLMRSGPSPRAAKALEMSLKTAPVAPEFAVERLRLLLATWDEFDAAGHAEIRRQIEMARRNPRTAKPLAALLAGPDGSPLAASAGDRSAPADAVR